ncbi:MAG: PhoPQ-activated pathogenicity [Phenylobacterium sp.]|uniref:PhoPQ-activated protein PqaA family protein n=1 Tax=Phenylobacterium sp. TaxID=1871053 RepID=UPI0025F56348|nr:PhoPQ-activated protein PqaA family protein [Phenylobacterium sp.]MBI1199309.1 PhoPQ-activated pathogenicity [Phenylobacterium sp.]
MKVLKLLGGALAALALGAAPAAANPPNALDAYVARPDPSFAWRVEKTFTGPGYRGAVLELTSQTWLSPKETDRSVWKHWLVVTIPDTVAHDKAMLFIDGGNNTDPAPKGPTGYLAKMATDTSSVVAELRQTPNQPMHLAGDPSGKARVEDEIIAYQWARYLNAGNPDALVRLPMVKGASAAMTAVQQYLPGEKLKVDGFVVAGASKRGWTTWLSGLLDERVIGIAPLVINTLDVDATAIHHWRALGYFSPALQDYVDERLIPDQIGKPVLEAVNAIEDPIRYLDRPRMKIPKYVVNAVGDEYFPPDNTRFSWTKLPGDKRLRMIPNANHSLALTDVTDSVTAWYDALISGRPIPEPTWTVAKDGTVVVSGAQGAEVRLWQATNPKARDFRVATLGRAFKGEVLAPRADGTYAAKVAAPAEGFTAWFLEMTYPSGGKYPFKFTTEVYVTPDVYPYRWEDARPITKPDR